MNLLNIMFPEKCIYCQKSGSFICDDCYKKLNYKAIFEKTIRKNFDYFISNYFYVGDLKKLMHNFKFHEKSYLYKYFIELSLKNEKIVSFLSHYDFITYIPMSHNKQLKRGYNQAELLAKELGKRLNKSVFNTLEKFDNVKVQSTLNETQREENAKNAFSYINNLDIKDKNIILVDDIFTTGSTVNSASKILKENNCKNICVFTITKAKLNRLDTLK